jgi:hypothetical protein
MYIDHVPILARHGTTPAGMADLIVFAICTQNQHFFRVRGIMDYLRAEGITTCTQLTGRQQRGIMWAQAHTAALCPLPSCTLEAMRRLIELPGIGIVKAGFILQMLGYNIGCLDVHNLRLAGLSPAAFKHVPTNTEGLTLKLRTYLATCASLGGTAHLWDQWCTLIACKYPRHFPTADAVSAYHVICVTGRQTYAQHI